VTLCINTTGRPAENAGVPLKHPEIAGSGFFPKLAGKTHHG
jgi:hypothetical protein